MFYTTSNIALDTGNSITWLILPTPLTHSLGITLQGPSIPKKYSYYTSLFKTILTLIFPPILRTPIIGNQLPSGQNSDFVQAEIPSFIILFLILIIFLCAVIYRKFLNCYPQRSLSIILTSKRIRVLTLESNGAGSENTDLGYHKFSMCGSSFDKVSAVREEWKLEIKVLLRYMGGDNGDMGCRWHPPAFLALLMTGRLVSICKFQRIDLMVTKMLGQV